MLKIDYIRLNNQKPLYFHKNTTVIFGGNNVGKTLLVDTINYILGQSTHDLWKKQGMENVESIECHAFCDDNSQLFLKRTIDKKNYYKRSSRDPYSMVDDTEYKNIIQSSFSKYDEELYKNYYSIVKESLSYRGIGYLNFIDQYSLGDSNNIIPEANGVEYYNRIKKQTMFIFDKEAQRKLNEYENSLKSIEGEIKKAEELIKKRAFVINGIKKEFDFLSIDYKDDVEELKRTYYEYKNKRVIPNNIHRGEKELVYLTKASSQLYSQLAIERRLMRQTDLLTNRNKKTEEILECFRSVIGNEQGFSKYLDAIENVLSEYGKRDIILSAKDFDQTITNLEKEKNKVDSRIKEISNDLSEKTYLDYAKSEAVLEQYFSLLDQIGKEKNIDELYDREKCCRQEIEKIKENINVSSAECLNSRITKSYLDMPDCLDFVMEDKKKEIKIQYIPRKRSLSAVMKTKEGKVANYVPGSKARQTCWQIIAFIELQKFIKDNYENFPLLPLLVIDGFNEPFTDREDTFKRVLEYLSGLCLDRGIQLIVVSTSNVGKNNESRSVIDLSSGFNKEHGKDKST